MSKPEFRCETWGRVAAGNPAGDVGSVKEQDEQAVRSQIARVDLQLTGIAGEVGTDLDENAYSVR